MINGLKTPLQATEKPIPAGLALDDVHAFRTETLVFNALKAKMLSNL